ncbi:ABC transporter ATP-binding protein [Myxococcota bacterium]|nr:ABC transporter ATP-binding protein [Myxococcota bacterium]MBP8970243.1 ABC transporter ATP-binding protein [Myxococcota bacterium]HHW97434.1 ABC transporter ATP-binding protein [Oligoflexales bacterium]
MYPGAIESPEAGRGTYAIQDLNLQIEAGEFVAIVGRSGSGKTTLLNILGGLDRDYEGQVFIADQNLAKMDDVELSKMRNQTIGFVFQAFHLLPQLTVFENVLLPSRFSDYSDTEIFQQRAQIALARTGLLHRASSLPTSLSAGERQRVAIARAILNRPPILLCDEPTGNLDAETGQLVLDLFMELCENDGTTLIIATHEQRVSKAATRKVVLEAGRLVDDGGKA